MRKELRTEGDRRGPARNSKDSTPLPQSSGKVFLVDLLCPVPVSQHGRCPGREASRKDCVHYPSLSLTDYSLDIACQSFPDSLAQDVSLHWVPSGRDREGTDATAKAQLVLVNSSKAPGASR